MDYNEYITIIDKLKRAEQKFSPMSCPTGLQNSVGLLTKDTKFEDMTQEQLILSHTALHMFYSSKNGKLLSKKTIEMLHKKLVPLIKEHKKFDKLDL